MKSSIRRALVVGALVASGLGVSAAASPVHASDQCNNEVADQNVYVGQYSVGVDNGSTGVTGVYAVCARSGDDTLITACAGVHEYTDTAGDEHFQPYAGVNACHYLI